MVDLLLFTIMITLALVDMLFFVYLIVRGLRKLRVTKELHRSFISGLWVALFISTVDAMTRLPSMIWAALTKTNQGNNWSILISLVIAVGVLGLAIKRSSEVYYKKYGYK